MHMYMYIHPHLSGSGCWFFENKEVVENNMETAGSIGECVRVAIGIHYAFPYYTNPKPKTLLCKPLGSARNDLCRSLTKAPRRR